MKNETSVDSTEYKKVRSDIGSKLRGMCDSYYPRLFCLYEGHQGGMKPLELIQKVHAANEEELEMIKRDILEVIEISGEFFDEKEKEEVKKFTVPNEHALAALYKKIQDEIFTYHKKNNRGEIQEIKIPFRDILPKNSTKFPHGIDIDYLAIGCINQNFLKEGISKTFKVVSDEIDKMTKIDTNLNKKQAEEKFEQEIFQTPWNFINQIFEDFSNEEFTYCYEVKRPTEIASDNLKVHLLNKITETEIEFEDLSSGEKILLTLTLFVYQNTIKTAFPRVLLLDEIDAVLHPSMCKKLIDTIKKTSLKITIVK